MATYAIGDIQGCYAALMRLLAQIQFDQQHDTLWSVGDMVNRGPQSLEVLRFLKSLGQRHQIVLGNHDLHLIASAYDVRDLRDGDTLAPILAAPDRDELIAWLRQCPLMVHDAALGYVMSHAGLAPSWDLSLALRLAREVEAVLCGDQITVLLQGLYGNEPDQWDEQLVGVDRWRCIINYFTRMRFCSADGRLELMYKGAIATKPPGLLPWFDVPQRANRDLRIVFGHWSALGGETTTANVFPLDTGCVWGGPLTALRLEDGVRFQVTSQ